MTIYGMMKPCSRLLNNIALVNIGEKDAALSYRKMGYFADPCPLLLPEPNVTFDMSISILTVLAPSALHQANRRESASSSTLINWRNVKQHAAVLVVLPTSAGFQPHSNYSLTGLLSRAAGI